MNPEIETYKYFVLGLIEQMKPRHVLEIGLGATASTAKHILTKRSFGFDLTIIDLYRNNQALEILHPFKDEYKIIYMDSTKPESYANTNPNLTNGINQPEIILLDGDHSPKAVFADISNIVLLNILACNGIIVAHDVAHSTVRYACQKAAEEYGLNFFCIPEINIGLLKYSY